MAKILSVKPSEFPEIIEVGTDSSIIPVHTKIEFHAVDLRLEMEYMLYLYAYDIRGKEDIPIILNNWDESTISAIPQETEDDMLGKISIHIIATSRIQSIDSKLKLKLGILNKNKHYERRHLKIFAELIPAVGVASKWSDAFEAGVAH
ncbi:hypothetical protein BC962_1336 [Gillisia mitskevichiae]|uniref:Uncharacterized protein n=1 Tax=Gillisia mitskevichiae TaxID=270921 RepID=A0A495PTK6_9FLAO|nr:hypothetical protein [Gillisia mitskevichiae]RKS53090.1 hypothetical protein BC962_1336 [Gillisia mitskevichiae]